MSAPASPTTNKARSRASGLLVLVLLSGFALTLAASLATGPAFDEEKRFAAVRRGADLVHAVSDVGWSSLVSSSARAIYEELSPFGVWSGILSAWVSEVLPPALGPARAVAGRGGWLLWTAIAPAALFLLVEASRGARAGALAAAALWGFPRWVHVAALAREPAVAASVWLCALAAYVRSLPPPLSERRAGAHRRHRAWGVVFAVVLGLGVATTLATLWVVPLVAAHYWLLHRRAAFRGFRRGRALVPAAVLWALGLSPLVLALTLPQLWRGGAASVAEWLFAPLSPVVEPLLYGGGSIVAPRDVPAGYAASFLLATGPALLLLLALSGFGVLAYDGVNVRRGRRARDAAGLGLLVALGIAAVLVGPALTPKVLVRFPPRVEAGMPFLAAAIGVALNRAASAVSRPRFGSFGALAVALSLATYGLLGVPTAGASFGLLARGTRGAVEGRRWTVGDGSEMGALAGPIDALGAPRFSVDAPEVPKGYFALLNQLGRMRTRLDTQRGAGGLSIVRGARPGAVATVQRDGATLWSLLRK